MGAFNCCKLSLDDRNTLINDYRKQHDENWDIPKTAKTYL